MWSKVDKKTEIAMLTKAIEFTGNHILYGRAMIDVSKKWTYSMLNFLTNKSANRKAYLGHCAVFYKLQIPEYIVRTAWKELTDEQRRLANLQAENTINYWELCHMKRLSDTLENGREDVTKMGYQMKLPLIFRTKSLVINE